MMKNVLNPINRLSLILTAFFLSILLGSCQKDPIDRYEIENSAIVFKATSSSFSLKGITEPETVLHIPVVLIGPKADYDRPIQVQVANDQNDDAKENVDFKLLETVLKAGEMATTIDLKVKELPEGVDRLSTTLNLQANDHFILGYPSYSSVKVVWSEEYVRPTLYVWRDWYNFFSRGYSRSYHELLVEIFGEDIEHYVSRISASRDNPDLIYQNIHWWYGANNRLREYVTKHDREHPDQPLMHSEDYEEFSNYNTSVGEGRKPEIIPTILSTLNAI